MTETTTALPVGRSDLRVSPLGLGTNTFNDPGDPKQFHTVLDGFVERGGTFIDTADMYSYWVPGNGGGESETIIGQWLAGRRNRDDVVIATKVSGKPDLLGLAPQTVVRGAEDSLRRLQTDHIDLFYAHYQDDETPIVESAAAFDRLVTEGKVRAVALSNFSVAAIEEWFRACEENGFARPVALQPRYSLVSREYETGLAGVAQRLGMSVFPYQVLAGGFLTGKYRSEADTEGRARGGAVKRYLTPEGLRVLDVLDAVAAEHGTEPAAVALAWATANGKVTAPLAAATSTAQLDQLFAAVALELTAEQVQRLDEASASFV
ncbi:Predicted oxidoreductase [Georgenia satyanarayanai]|uniref:Predicted oxidoreductase n=1 Tax=Georgenia satyanarayanai TaxID=860221 RepID=A0A2Y9C4Q9_9MICO|nr:aldo/keto reductase [Georgenia satyanarayanai]PYG00624.1 aryl-alcohol dehydrogenase-like predicted oxidoreductase [Georgenia satyanarayanai]SSA40013.1 Predicted oxidoreductase [Georgenia satyanarayanai]